MSKTFDNEFAKAGTFVVDYGWVPFRYFQQFMIIGIIGYLWYYREINQYLDQKLYRHIEDERYKNTVKVMFALIPIIIIIAYLDINYSSFSMKNIGVTNYISDDLINVLIKIFGAYCIIQVAAQDIGLRTGVVQSYISQLPLIQFGLFVGAAYVITQNRSGAIIAALVYFLLKYIASDGITNPDCFADTSVCHADPSQRDAAPQS